VNSQAVAAKPQPLSSPPTMPQITAAAAAKTQVVTSSKLASLHCSGAASSSPIHNKELNGTTIPRVSNPAINSGGLDRGSEDKRNLPSADDRERGGGIITSTPSVGERRTTESNEVRSQNQSGTQEEHGLVPRSSSSSQQTDSIDARSSKQLTDRERSDHQDNNLHVNVHVNESSSNHQVKLNQQRDPQKSNPHVQSSEAAALNHLKDRGIVLPKNKQHGGNNTNSGRTLKDRNQGEQKKHKQEHDNLHGRDNVRDRERGLQNDHQNSNTKSGQKVKDTTKRDERKNEHKEKSNTLRVPKQRHGNKECSTYDRKSKRKSRCGQCKACTRKDCGTCRHCLDKPKFGGKNVTKQVCVKRVCRDQRTTEITIKPPAKEKVVPAQGDKVPVQPVPLKTKAVVAVSKPVPAAPPPPLIVPNGALYYHQILYGSEKNSQNENTHTNHNALSSTIEEVYGKPQKRAKLQYTEGQSFPHKLYNLIEHASWNGHGDIVSWSEQGCAFIIHDHARLATELLGLHFTCHSDNHVSFIRRIIDWNFLKISPAAIKYTSPGGLSFMHPFFERGKPFNLPKIKRTKDKKEYDDDEEGDGYDSANSEESLVF